MKRPRQILTFAALVLLLGAPVAALSEAPADRLDRNRKLLDSLRSDADQYALLVRDLTTFNGLPVTRQDRLRRLDHDLQEELSAVQARLLRAGERYVRWLQKQSPQDRDRIDSEPDKARRVERVKEIRRRQWLEELPRADRERVQRAQGTERDALVRQLRADERQRRHDWHLAARNWDEVSKRDTPHRLEDFRPVVRQFVNSRLRRLLSKDEEGRLEQAADSGLYPFVLIELADKHPVVFPAANSGPKHLKELPKILQDALAELPAAAQSRLREADGRWPDFALTVTALANQRKIPLPKQLGPCRPKEYPPPWQPVIHQVNERTNGTEEAQQLSRAAGRWPAYHFTLLALAYRHHVAMPQGVKLPLPSPGAPGWDNYRDHLAAGVAETSVVSDAVLREFARTELSPDDRVRFGTSLNDPLSRHNLQQAYVKRHPDEWLRIQLSDQQKKMRR